jgi:DNA-sulfur modification-associated
LNPLIWNLRPGAFEGFWNDNEDALHIYSGKIYLPDSHHRHQAIIKAVRLWRSAPKDYPRFKGDREFKIELYFLSRQDEGNYFFDKNQRPKPTEKSKAYDLTTLDDLSLLAKKVIDYSKALQGNVNRVTDRLIAKNPQVITLSTLREMMKTFAPTETFDTSELEGLASVAAQFYDMLASVRPELGKKEAGERRVVRESLLVDSATMMHGYAAVMKEFNADLGRFGPSRATDMWKKRLQRLKSNISYQYGKWRGDFFEKRNPLWRSVGIAKPGRDGKRLTVLNTGAARSECGRILRSLLAADGTPRDLQFLVSR